MAAGDERESRVFIEELRRRDWLFAREPASLRTHTRVMRAVHCGSGNGRVSQNVLLTAFDEVDLVDPSANSLATSRRDIEASASDVRRVGRLERMYNVPLQEFTPETGRGYDVIWLQEVTGYLLDADLVSLLVRLRSALTFPSLSRDADGNVGGVPGSTNGGGLLVVKESVHFLDGPDVQPWFDEQIMVLARTRTHFHKIFKSAGLKLLLERNTNNSLSEGYLPIWFFVLR